jgi:hypothetical protein
MTALLLHPGSNDGTIISSQQYFPHSELPGVSGQVCHYQHPVDIQYLLVLREGLSG